MNFKIEGIEHLDHTITTMMADLKKVGNEDVPNEFFNWEAEDLRRKSPWVRKIGRRKAYMTMVRPHSAASMRMRHRALMKARRKHKTLSRGGSEPILRPELLSELVKRMRTLLGTIRWR
jgi:hypothetical protein